MTATVVILIAITVVTLPGDMSQEAFGQTIPETSEFTHTDGIVSTSNLELGCDYTVEHCPVNY